MFIDKKTAMIRANELNSKLEAEIKLENIKFAKVAEEQRLLIKKTFKTFFQSWYIEHMAGLTKNKTTFSIVNNDHNIFDGCLYPNIDYSIRFLPEHKATIKNELFTVINPALKASGFKIYKVVFKQEYFLGYYLNIYISICDINNIIPRCCIS
jgi:hypothetical protein